MIIFVSDSRNRILAPTIKKDWAIRLVRQGKAKMMKGPILRIKLNYPVTSESRDTTTYYSIGVDSGYENIGFCVMKVGKDTISKLFFGTITTRTAKIKELLAERKMYRQSRRRNRRNKAHSQKFRHPRWKNRKDKLKLTPTVRHLIETHTNIVKLCFKYIPKEGSRINLEYAKFDPTIVNKPGSKSFFTNMRYFILNRDNYTCRYCKTKELGTIFEVHHKIERKHGGTDNSSNLITLCKKCHSKHHKHKINANGSSLNQAKKGAGVLNTAMPYIYDELVALAPTYKYFGYETFDERHKLGLDKTHSNDAMVLSLFETNYRNLKCKDFGIRELDINQIQRHPSRAKVSKIENRKYRRFTDIPTASAIAYNRNKRTGQTDKSLADFKRLSKIIPSYRFKLKVYPGKIVYRQKEIDFNPGDLVKNIQSKEVFVVKGSISNYRVNGYHGQTSPRQDPNAKYLQSSTITLKRNSGLVII